MTLDELFLTYEKTGQRQERLIKTIAAAFGASSDEDSESTPITNIHLDQGPQVKRDGDRPGDENYNYGGGDIKLGTTTAFGYRTVEKID